MFNGIAVVLIGLTVVCALSGAYEWHLAVRYHHSGMFGFASGHRSVRNIMFLVTAMCLVALGLMLLSVRP